MDSRQKLIGEIHEQYFHEARGEAEADRMNLLRNGVRFLLSGHRPAMEDAEISLFFGGESLSGIWGKVWRKSRARNADRWRVVPPVLARAIAEKAMAIASEICIYTNANIVLEEL